MNSSRRPAGDLAVEPDHQDVVGAGLASSRPRVSIVVRVGGACSGRSTAIGCGSKVTATTVSAPSRAAQPRAPGAARAAWPRCTPSKLPMRHDGAAQVGRHLVDVTPDPHGEEPPTPPVLRGAGGSGARRDAVLRGAPHFSLISRYMPMNACGMPPMEASGQKQSMT